MPDDDMRTRVFSAIHNAMNNDYYMQNDVAEEIIDSLIRYDKQFKNSIPANLLPHVIAWLEEATA